MPVCPSVCLSIDLAQLRAPCQISHAAPAPYALARSRLSGDGCDPCRCLTPVARRGNCAGTVQHEAPMCDAHRSFVTEKPRVADVRAQIVHASQGVGTNFLLHSRSSSCRCVSFRRFRNGWSRCDRAPIVPGAFRMWMASWLAACQRPKPSHHE